jgi:hypothetical protein
MVATIDKLSFYGGIMHDSKHFRLVIAAILWNCLGPEKNTSSCPLSLDFAGVLQVFGGIKHFKC